MISPVTALVGWITTSRPTQTTLLTKPATKPRSWLTMTMVRRLFSSSSSR